MCIWLFYARHKKEHSTDICLYAKTKTKKSSKQTTGSVCPLTGTSPFPIPQSPLSPGHRHQSRLPLALRDMCQR